MKLQSQREADNTRDKLKLLEEQYVRASSEPNENEYVHNTTLRSLKRLINQLKEELAWFESRQITKS